MKEFLTPYKKRIIIFILAVLILTAILDKQLAAGFLLVVFLCLITFLIISKLGIKDKNLYIVFFIAFLIHLVAVFFIYYTGFRPFGGGADYEMYNQTGIEISQRFGQGNFSLEGLHISHLFPILIGFIYLFFFPGMLVGQMFSVWLASLSVLFVYLLSLEINTSKRSALLISLITCFYPSYVYFGSLLLKDSLVIPLTLFSFLLIIKIIKEFSLKLFGLFFIVLTFLIHLRFYIGYPILFVFILCWFLISSLNLKKRVIYGLIFVIILGFSPQISGYGYYGLNSIIHYFNKDVITVYREETYIVTPLETSVALEATESTQKDAELIKPVKDKLSKEFAQEFREDSGESFAINSSFQTKTDFSKLSNFVIEYAKSFIYTLLGPLPWQIKNFRQSFSLFETIPWYLLIFVFLFSFVKSFKQQGLAVFKKYKLALPLLIFALLGLGVISLFITNFGTILRVRITSLIAILSLMSLEKT